MGFSLLRLAVCGLTGAAICGGGTPAFAQQSPERMPGVVVGVDPANVGGEGRELLEAVAAGDIGRIMRLGGSPMDVMAALRVILVMDPDIVLIYGRTIAMDTVAYHSSPVLLREWMAQVDEMLAGGRQPLFINYHGSVEMAFSDSQGGLTGFTNIPGMAVWGLAPVGIPYDVPAPDRAALEPLRAQNQARQAALSAAFLANQPPPAWTTAEPQLSDSEREALQAYSQADAALFDITPPFQLGRKTLADSPELLVSPR